MPEYNAEYNNNKIDPNQKVYEKNTKALSVGNNVTHVIEDQHAYIY